MKLRSVTTRLRQGNARGAVYNRWAKRTGRRRRLLRHAYPNLARAPSRRLNRLLAELPGASRYLEIGLYLGSTFETIRVNERFGVDPDPRFDSLRLPKGARVYSGTSDDFFRSLPAEQLFDVVFVDGLHHFEQAYRDIVNSFDHLTPGGVVLVDDVVPYDETSAIRDWSEAIAKRRATGSQTWAWNGDVFLAVKVLVEHHPSIRVRTIIGSGEPQAVAWRTDTTPIKAISDAVLETYSSLRYVDVFAEGLPHSFAPGSEDEVLNEAITAGCVARQGHR